MDELFDDAAARAKRYWQSLSERRVSPASDALARLTELEEPFPADQSDPRAVLALLDEIGSPATLATAGPRFFGFVIGGALPATVAANWLAAAWDQNAGLDRRLAGRRQARRDRARLAGRRCSACRGTGAGFVTGATMANFTALAAARHAVLERVGWNVEADGLFGAPPITVVVGDEAHPTLMRSRSACCGLRAISVSCACRWTARDACAPRSCRSSVGPTIVCIQAGNVNTGAFDPAADLCALGARAGRLGARRRRVRPVGRGRAASARISSQGVEQADSWATDAHKWLNVPVRQRARLRARPGTRCARAWRSPPPICHRRTHREPSHFTPELSRRARGVEVWAALRTLGRAGLAEMIERNCRQATRFAEGLRDAGYEILNDVVLNQVLVSFGDAGTHPSASSPPCRTTAPAGAAAPSGRGGPPCASASPPGRTTDEDVERSLAAMIRLARSA